jgi:hypothetical protein
MRRCWTAKSAWSTDLRIGDERERARARAALLTRRVRSGAIRGFNVRVPTFAPAVQLGAVASLRGAAPRCSWRSPSGWSVGAAKRWLSAHMLSDLIAPEAVELLMVHVCGGAVSAIQWYAEGTERSPLRLCSL